MRLGWFARMLNVDVEVKVVNENGEVLFKGTVQSMMDGLIRREVFYATVTDWTFHQVFPFVLVKVEI